jgi:hypothetical protein
MMADWPVRQICVGTFAAAGRPMTHLAWDESGACVLAWLRLVTRFADVKPGHARPGAAAE